jgi:hypothetical protein
MDNALTSKSIAPMTHTTMHPHAQITDPVVSAATSKAKPIAARTSVKTSMVTPKACRAARQFL